MLTLPSLDCKISLLKDGHVHYQEVIIVCIQCYCLDKISLHMAQT